jgi:hypothetical protein
LAAGQEPEKFFQLFRGFSGLAAVGNGPVFEGAWRAYKEVRRPIQPAPHGPAKIQLFRGLRSLDMGGAIDNNPRSAATPFSGGIFSLVRAHTGGKQQRQPVSGFNPLFSVQK